MQWMRCLTLITACLTLAACRLEFQTQGAGVVYAENAQAIYRNGQVLEINADYQERFQPVPLPGRRFLQWHNLCVEIYDACDLVLGRAAWEQDEQFPLRAEFSGPYRGPLTLLDLEMWWYPLAMEFRIPVDSVLTLGVQGDSPIRVFVASSDRRRVIAGKRSGDDYVFQLGPADDPDRFWPFITARDRDDSIASVSFELGFEDLGAAAMRPHNAATPWADVLRRCALPMSLFDLCNLNTLPYIGTTSGNIDATAIMARTLVSHPWMGKRFRELLLQLPPELLQMFRSVTTVVIGSEIRPSFYSPATGAIYLDPADLWLTPAERSTVSTEADYRDAFESDFSFFPFWVYVEGNTEAWTPSGAWPGSQQRSISDIVLPMATLLLHELTHANDSVPGAQLAHAQGADTPLDLAGRIYDQTPSAQLYATYPLNSPLLYELAASYYNGLPPSNAILSLTAGQAGWQFGGEYANDLYAFSAAAEDTAMLVEEVLARHFFGIDRIVAFVDAPGAVLSPQCADYVLRWGNRNRVFAPAIRERARTVLSAILDESDISAYLDNTPRQQRLSAGQGLCHYYQLRSFDSSQRGQSLSLPARSSAQLARAERHRKIRQLLDDRHQRHRAR